MTDPEGPKTSGSGSTTLVFGYLSNSEAEKRGGFGGPNVVTRGSRREGRERAGDGEIFILCYFESQLSREWTEQSTRVKVISVSEIVKGSNFTLEKKRTTQTKIK